MRTFVVSDVRPAMDPLPTLSRREAVETLARAPLEALYRADTQLARAWAPRLVKRDGRFVEEHAPYHPFVAAVHAAFDQHRPLVLSPDAIWLMIAQGFATHVMANADALRARLVAHEGRELISVRRDDFVKGSALNPWPEVLDAFSAQVAERTRAHALVVADFSTTGVTERAACAVTLLATVQRYFVLELRTRCGIPTTTLTGTSDDWRSLRMRAERLRGLECDAWIDALVPVLDALFEAHEGRVDRGLFESLYKLESRSGGPYIAGWINVFFPYLIDRGGAPEPSPFVASWRDGASAWRAGPTLEELPSGLCRAPMIWKYLADELRMELLAGFTAVAQDPETLALCPEIGWAIRDLGAAAP